MRGQFFDDEIAAKGYDAKLARKSFAFILPYKKRVLITVIPMVIVASTGLVTPSLMKYAIDLGMGKRDIHVLKLCALAYVITYVLRWACQFWQTRSQTRLSQHFVFDMRYQLFKHIQSLSLTFFDNREIGRIISRLTSDISSINALITSGALGLVPDFLMMVGAVALMVRENAKLSLLTFTVLPLIWAASEIFQRKHRLAYRTMRKNIATVTAHVAENVSGVKVVKSFSRERENLQRFMQVNRENRDSAMRPVMLSNVFWPSLEVISTVGQGIVYSYGGAQVIQGHMTIGVLIAFTWYLSIFFQPIINTSRLYQTMQDAMVGAERVFEIFDTEPIIQDKPGAVELSPIRGSVEFRHVSFAYGETPILKDVDFRVEPGQTIALVGPTGAGKTTIVNLLARQYDVKDGAIFIDGYDVRDVTMRSLRRQMGVVLQESFLFPGSVRENIRYGRLDATDEEIENAARAVGAHDFIIEMPEGYNTDVREGGSKLSSGQKQIIAFARALIADPRILILDEATASVDTQTEQLIQSALRKLLEGRTSFVIAHRLSTIVEADRILVIEGGQLAESGTHHELLEHDGLYRRLYEMQFNFGIADELVRTPPASTDLED